MMYFDSQKGQEDDDIHNVGLELERQKLTARNDSAKDMKTIKQNAREQFNNYMMKEKRKEESERTKGSSIVKSTAAEDLNFMDAILNPARSVCPVKDELESRRVECVARLEADWLRAESPTPVAGEAGCSGANHNGPWDDHG